MKDERPDWLDRWFTEVIDSSHFAVRKSAWRTSSKWHFIQGRLVHETGRFFKVVGTRYLLPDRTVDYRPLIEQREIGTLGFMTCDTKDGKYILLQAKIEPGNVGICQLAPSYQATASNADCMHGGTEPAYKRYFTNVKGTLQSEQGTRFLGKLNRNVVISVDEMIEPTYLHTWKPVDQLLQLVHIDNLINTDARSVLVCADWESLVDQPFTSLDDLFTRSLRQSYLIKDDVKIDKIKLLLQKLRQQTSLPEEIPLEELPGWKITDKKIEPIERGPFSVIHIDVTSHDREVASWSQPIIDSHSSGLVDLYCAQIDGVLRFFMPPQIEAGLVHKVELGPSHMKEPGGGTFIDGTEGLNIRASVLQSDEGGRFYQDTTLYRIVEVDTSAIYDTELAFWLSLGEIKQLLRQEGFFTNEARSALSLLLKWL